MADVKICGLSTLDTLEVALVQGAAMVGLVFFAKSPRNVSLAQAVMLANHVRHHPSSRAKIVALVVDAEDGPLKEIAQRVRPDFIQAHGSETPQRVSDIAAFTGIPVIKAIKVATALDVETAKQYEGRASMILFDAKAPEVLADALPGGNGISFDWSLLGDETGYMLSGGLNPDNVAHAISSTGATLVDVSSGVETAPGRKDKTLIAKFIEAARTAR